MRSTCFILGHWSYHLLLNYMMEKSNQTGRSVGLQVYGGIKLVMEITETHKLVRYFAEWLRPTGLNQEYHRLSILNHLHVTGIRMVGKLIIWMMMHQLVIQDKRESDTIQDERTLEGLLLPVCIGMGIPFLEQSYQIRILLMMRRKLTRNKGEYVAVSGSNTPLIQPAVRLLYLQVRLHKRRPFIMWKLITVVAHQISTLGYSTLQSLHLAKATDQEDGLSNGFDWNR